MMFNIISTRRKKLSRVILSFQLTHFLHFSYCCSKCPTCRNAKTHVYMAQSQDLKILPNAKFPIRKCQRNEPIGTKYLCLKYIYRLFLVFLYRVRLMCVLKAHIKFSIFENIFSRIEKAVITFSILEKILSKNGN